jgi:type III secretion system FlhB-like substrate exporter
LIEDITIDSKGRAVPKLYNKLQASKELRAMLNLSAKSEAPDVTKLSDSELIEQLARQAKELGISIDLNYSFAKPKKTDE